MKRFSWFAGVITPFIWAITIILALTFGIWFGSKVATGYKDAELRDLQSELETANASLAEANVELSFWQNTVLSLGAGNQLPGVQKKIDGKGVDIKGKEEE